MFTILIYMFVKYVEISTVYTILSKLRISVFQGAGHTHYIIAKHTQHTISVFLLAVAVL